MTRLFRRAALAAALLLSSTACDDFLDVNTNPNGPETVTANLYLPPMLHWMATAPLYDGRFVGRYTQQWHFWAATTPTQVSTWDRMGYDATSDNGAQQWREVYWTLGQNLVDMNTKAAAEERWDLLGVGLILKAWGWQVLVDLHGPIIITEAFDATRFEFNYDTEEFAYQEVHRLLDSAIVLLARTDGAVDQAYLARGDRMYNGDRAKWTRFAHGLKAMSLNHFSNKASYDPLEVIAEVDLAFASNADDALQTYPGTQNDDINFWGRTRGNIQAYRQTEFVLGLMNGTAFGGVVDPRMTRMLAPSPDGQYRGGDIDLINGGLSTALIPNNLHGYPGVDGLNLPGRYIFDNRARIPVMTYSQLQFVKAEAAYRAGNFPVALQAYRNGVDAHITFVNARNLDNAQTPTQISGAERTAFLAAPAIVPALATDLTLTQIMVQKYIAQWGWGHNELWMDMRRIGYTALDPVTGTQVYPGFNLPTNIFVDNGGATAQRIRPRYNSEYVWNRAALEAIGGLALDYHTVPLWITQP